jgi:hypothetical protein
MPTFTPPTVPNRSLSDDDLLWRFFQAPDRGLNVWKYTDGTYETTDAWPFTTDGVGKVVAIAYYGGHSYPISAGEAASLTAAGYGAYIT